MSEKLKVGKIANTHGLKGEVKIYPYLNVKEDYETFGKLTFEGVSEEFEIERVRYFKKMVIVKFKNIDDINDIEKYKGKLVYVEKDDLDENNIYIEDLIGMDVVDVNLGKIGVLKSFISKSVQDVLVIESLTSDKEILIPDVDEFVLEINSDEKVITVKVIEGMI
ncbi:ribosome maturation factor RimM [Helicovermis profundi]|uniref:Ribosome maturation factor RimM n=1 Tax=Helicovermis profundi TaxID=3065157 RepID=A0AAU9E7K6_9FIRM|nr:ribosome maturation factor RimM [Clostridia bacterium S502]